MQVLSREKIAAIVVKTGNLKIISRTTLIFVQILNQNNNKLQLDLKTVQSNTYKRFLNITACV